MFPTPSASTLLPQPRLRWRDRWHAFWQPPEEHLIAAGLEGELVVARVRMVLVGIMALIPLANLLLVRSAVDEGHVTGLIMNQVGFVISLSIYATIRSGFRPRWLSVLTSCLDVTFFTAALFIFALSSDPHGVVNSKIVFEMYFLALGATCMRYDRRIAVVAGIMAIVQYGLLILWISSNYTLDMVGGASPYGRFTWADQISRLILLAVATILNVHIVSAIQKARLLSNADPLTGVFNRRFFDDYFVGELERARRYRQPVAVAMVDVDHFKQFNDRYGHAVGDDALRRVARALQRHVRRSDLVARYGGEEFVVLLRDVTAVEATVLFEAIRVALHAEPLPVGSGLLEHITVSIGVAVLPEDGQSVDSLTETADQRLFQAKAAGRNRVVGASHGPGGSDKRASVA